MEPLGVPLEFRGRVSDDGRQELLTGMQLASVPEWLWNMTGLSILDLSDNELTSVPEWMGT
jgi:Leucine-rich repeat (LRR) protein